MEFFDGKAVGIELPQTVILTVIETEPGLKSATASSVTKAAKTETGLVVQVPPFINEGEKIKVDTSEGAYLSQSLSKLSELASLGVRISSRSLESIESPRSAAEFDIASSESPRSRSRFRSGSIFSA